MKCIRPFALLILLVQTCFLAHGQKIFAGYLKDSITKEVIPFAGVVNISSRKTVMTNTNGFFLTEIKMGNIIAFASVGYNYDTLLITPQLLQNVGNDTLVFYLHPLANSLQEVTVTVKSKFNRYQLDSMQRRSAFFSNKSDTKIPVVANANSGTGIGINLDHFYKREKRKRAAIDFFDDIENQAYINYRFTPALVNKYAALTGNGLAAFMQQYRPSAAWLRAHLSEEDLLYYINEKLKQFDKRKFSN